MHFPEARNRTGTESGLQWTRVKLSTRVQRRTNPPPNLRLSLIKVGFCSGMFGLRRARFGFADIATAKLEAQLGSQSAPDVLSCSVLPSLVLVWFGLAKLKMYSPSQDSGFVFIWFGCFQLGRVGSGTGKNKLKSRSTREKLLQRLIKLEGMGIIVWSWCADLVTSGFGWF